MKRKYDHDFFVLGRCPENVPEGFGLKIEEWRCQEKSSSASSTFNLNLPEDLGLWGFAKTT